MKPRKITAEVEENHRGCLFLQAVVSGNHRLTFPFFHTVGPKIPIQEAQRKRKTKENTENRVVSTVPTRFKHQDNATS